MKYQDSQHFHASQLPSLNFSIFGDEDDIPRWLLVWGAMVWDDWLDMLDVWDPEVDAGWDGAGGIAGGGSGGSGGLFDIV